MIAVSGTTSIWPGGVFKKRIGFTKPHVLFPIIIAIGTAPLLFIFIGRLWLNEHYRFFPIVLAASGWCLYKRWPTSYQKFGRLDRGIAIVCFATGFVLIVAGAILWSPWIHAVGALFTSFFLIIYLAGGGAVARMGSCWLLLWLIIPPPTNLAREFVLGLQGIASRMSGIWLDIIGINHVLSGHVIHLPGQRFLVEEACSGTNSFLVMLSLAAIFAMFARYPFIPTFLLILAAIGCSIVGNCLRIVALVTLAHYGYDLSTGWGHTFLGIIAFTSALGLVFSCDRLILFLLSPTDMRRQLPPTLIESHVAVSASERYLIGRFEVLALTALFLVFAATTIGQLFSNASTTGQSHDIAELVKRGRDLEHSAIILPTTGWKLVRFDRDHKLKQNSRVSSTNWQFEKGGATAQLSLDFPFRGWHELSYCYTAQGWTLADRRILDDQFADNAKTVGFDLERPTGGFGYVIVSLFDAHGKLLTPPPTNGWSIQGLVAILLDRLRQRGSEVDEIKPVYQFQVFISSESPLNSIQRTEIAELYVLARRQIIQKTCGVIVASAEK